MIIPLKSLAVSIAVIIGLLGFQDVPKAIKIPLTQNEQPIQTEKEISHQQKVWIFALELQYKIVSRMVNDKNITPYHWKNVLFPGCVKKIGLPPK